jgi:hypothetical protein
MPRPAGAFLVALAMIAIGVFASGCTAAGPDTTAELARQLPMPTLATLSVGQDGAGYDEGASFLTYKSALPPEEALGLYGDQLIAAGFAEMGRDGAWRLYSRGDMLLGVNVPGAGPPSTIIVRVRYVSADGSQTDGQPSVTPKPGQGNKTDDPNATITPKPGQGNKTDEPNATITPKPGGGNKTDDPNATITPKPGQGNKTDDPNATITPKPGNQPPPHPTPSHKDGS